MFRMFLAGPLVPRIHLIRHLPKHRHCEMLKTGKLQLLRESRRSWFIIQSVTRWNSLYDSMKDLLKNLDGSMTQINNICLEQKPCLPIFNKTDKVIIAEYIEVMTPIAVRLDMFLLPNLFLLKDNLVELQREVKKFNYAKNLVNYLLKQPNANKGKEKGFEPRFSRIFDDCDLLMATALHPHFKLGVVRRLNEGKYPAVKTRIYG